MGTMQSMETMQNRYWSHVDINHITFLSINIIIDSNLWTKKYHLSPLFGLDHLIIFACKHVSKLIDANNDNIQYIRIAKAFHVCNGVTPPENLDCFADNSTTTGYRFDCWEECDADIVNSHICANDNGKYHSKCYMQRETCKMYGRDQVQNVRVETCPTIPSKL